MVRSKNPEFDLKIKHKKLTEVGLITSLALVTLLFLFYRTDFETEFKVQFSEMKLEVEDVPLTQQIKRPPPPPRPAVAIPSDDLDIPEDETIEFTEIDFENVGPPPEPGEGDAEYEFVAYDEPPVIIGGMQALLEAVEYPEIARKAGVEGKCIMNVLVDTKGNPVKVKVLQSCKIDIGFEEAAARALYKMKWKPAYQRDIPVKVWISVPVTFRLRNTQPAI